MTWGSRGGWWVEADPRFGLELMSEMRAPATLVEHAVKAEHRNLDFVSISDHIHPWLPEHDHSPFAWSVLGAIVARTERIGTVTGVTCPTIRYHPVIIAQAAATIGQMSNGRFTLGLGAGERLNEHVTGAPFPSHDRRHAMLAEAIEIMTLLWQGSSPPIAASSSKPTTSRSTTYPTIPSTSSSP